MLNTFRLVCRCLHQDRNNFDRNTPSISDDDLILMSAVRSGLFQYNIMGAAFNNTR